MQYSHIEEGSDPEISVVKVREEEGGRLEVQEVEFVPGKAEEDKELPSEDKQSELLEQSQRNVNTKAFDLLDKLTTMGCLLLAHSSTCALITFLSQSCPSAGEGGGKAFHLVNLSSLSCYQRCFVQLNKNCKPHIETFPLQLL